MITFRLDLTRLGYRNKHRVDKRNMTVNHIIEESIIRELSVSILLDLNGHCSIRSTLKES